jgi:hypothetical protein
MSITAKKIASSSCFHPAMVAPNEYPIMNITNIPQKEKRSILEALISANIGNDLPEALIRSSGSLNQKFWKP